MGRKVELGAIGGLLLLLAAVSTAGEARRFDFTTDGNAARHLPYDAARGYGFEPDAGGRADRFSVRLPEGNYRVTMQVSQVRRQAALSVFAEQRRLMASATMHAWPTELAFIVNVRTPELPALPENATGGSRVALKPRELGSASWDDKLTLEFSLRSIDSLVVESVSVPTLYLAGDSTVTDQPQPPSASWGQFLPAYFDDGVSVANHAESGESLKSFVTELRLAKLLSTLQAGDWVMIQFGHNDQKTQWPQTYVDAAGTYSAWLRTYIAEIRRRGATPLLVTSPERRNFDAAGRITPSLGDYPAAVRALAHEQRLALIDLHATSIRFYEALGPTVAAKAFADAGRDKTHHNEYGAGVLAALVIRGLRAADPALTAGLEKHLVSRLPPLDPANPPPPFETEATPP